VSGGGVGGDVAVEIAQALFEFPHAMQAAVADPQLGDDGVAGGVEVLSGGAQGRADPAPGLGGAQAVHGDRGVWAGQGGVGLLEGVANPFDDAERSVSRSPPGATCAASTRRATNASTVAQVARCGREHTRPPTVRVTAL